MSTGRLEMFCLNTLGASDNPSGLRGNIDTSDSFIMPLELILKSKFGRSRPFVKLNIIISSDGKDVTISRE